MRSLQTSVRFCAVCVAMVGSGAVFAAEPDLSPAQQFQILESLAPGFVRVEITLRYDQGDAPTGAGWAERCPNCGNYHAAGYGEDVVREHRPFEMSGFLIAPDRVLTRDLQIHPRFIERIEVRAGQQLVPAQPAAYPLHEPGLILQLSTPLTDARPLTFAAGRPGPYYSVTYQRTKGDWAAALKPLGGNVTSCDTGVQFRAVQPVALIVDAEGQPVGATMSGELPVADTWRGSPTDWPVHSIAELTALLGRVEGVAKQGLLHVTLKFRSPRKKADGGWRGGPDDEESATEAHTIGVLLNPRTLLILNLLRPPATARLEQIVARLADGTQVSAKFGHTLREYGCFTAELERTLPGAVSVLTDDIRTVRDTLLVAAEVTPYGDQCIMRFVPTRVPGFRVGYKRNIYPELPQREDNLFLFTLTGQLVVAPLQVRQPASVEDRWRSRSDAVCTPLTPVMAQLADLAANADPSNVPLSEEAEDRIAWLGVELQNLDAELARANGVSDLTQNGDTGTIVSYVYPGSPAAEQGVQPGWVLLRLHPADRPQPIPVRSEDYQYGEDFPWDRLDELPEQYYEQVPMPWPSVDNAFNQVITELGFGQAFKAEFFHDGQRELRDFTVVLSPPHYGTAAKFKSVPLGLTVKDMTYEVCRYFQHAAGEPGVIVAKIEPGSRASVAGLKPFELITHVNDEPIPDAATFEKLVSTATEELRLNVKRMTRARIVKIAPGPASSQPAAAAPAQ